MCRGGVAEPVRRTRPDYNPPMPEGSYICPSCGEEIVVPVDPSAGPNQDYVEDCPVCCCPNLLHVTVLVDETALDESDVRIHAEPEAD